MSNKEVTFRIENIEVDDFSLSIPEFNFSNENLSFEVGLQWFTLNEEKKFKVTIPILICYETNGNKVSIGKIKTSTYFLIANFDELINKENDKLNISKEIMANFVNISYATTRGILLEKSASILTGLILPLISPLKLLNPTK